MSTMAPVVKPSLSKSSASLGQNLRHPHLLLPISAVGGSNNVDASHGQSDA